jgi:hypothetical protein
VTLRRRLGGRAGHAPHCSPIVDINTEHTGWAGARLHLHLESGGGGGCSSSSDCSCSTAAAAVGPAQAAVGAKEGATAAPTPAPGEGGLFPSPLCFQSPEIAAAALRPCSVFSSALALFSSALCFQSPEICCMLYKLLAHCSLQRLLLIDHEYK